VGRSENLPQATSTTASPGGRGKVKGSRAEPPLGMPLLTGQRSPQAVPNGCSACLFRVRAVDDERCCLCRSRLSGSDSAWGRERAGERVLCPRRCQHPDLRGRGDPLVMAFVPRASCQAPSKATPARSTPANAVRSWPPITLCPSLASAKASRRSASQPAPVTRQWAWRHRQKLSPHHPPAARAAVPSSASSPGLGRTEAMFRRRSRPRRTGRQAGRHAARTGRQAA